MIRLFVYSHLFLKYYYVRRLLWCILLSPIFEMQTPGLKCGVAKSGVRTRSSVSGTAEFGVLGFTRELRSPGLQSSESGVRECTREAGMYLSSTIAFRPYPKIRTVPGTVGAFGELL